MRKPPPGLFVTGNDTGVGKTFVAALVVRALRAAGRRVGVYKPVASGCARREGQLVSDDAVALWEAAGQPGPIERVCPQMFEAAVAPHLAARRTGREVDEALLFSGRDAWAGECDVLVVEGAGGLMSPLSDELYVADLVEAFGYPLIVVADNSVGVINRTLQTLIAAVAYGQGLHVAGIVLNEAHAALDDLTRTEHRLELTARAVPPVLAEVQYGAREFARGPEDWFELCAQG